MTGWLRRLALRVLAAEMETLAADLTAAQADLTAARSDVRDTLAALAQARAHVAGVQRFNDKDKCRKVPLYSDDHVTAWIAHIRATTAEDGPMRDYRCTVCPAHPLLGPVRHVTHAIREERGLRHPDARAAARAKRSLRHGIPRERLAEIRANLAADDGGTAAP